MVGKNYIGKTCRSIQTRFKKHIANTNHNRIKNSVIAEYSCKCKHQIFFDQTKILASTSHYWASLIREAIKYEKNPNNFNQEDGYKLSKSWRPLVHQPTHHWYLTHLFTSLSFLLFHPRFLLNCIFNNFILFILILINLLIN